jgi:ELWxxDGT repeat protein
VTAVGSHVYFTAVASGVSNRTLFVVDGTSVTPLAQNVSQGSLAAVGDTLYFNSGVDLYRTDGTQAGTKLVKAGVAYGPPVAVGAKVYFEGYTSGYDFELWQSDGTAAGTVPVSRDPAAPYTAPLNLTNVGGTLYFAAHDAAHGTELWKYTPDVAAPPPTVASVTVNDGTAQRSQVKQLTVTFDRPVTLGDNAFKLVRLNTGGSGADNGSAPTNATSVLNTPTTADGGKTWVITFIGPGPFMQMNGATPTGRLVDGIYTLSVDPTEVTADGIAMSAAPAPFSFHRLFGDVSGNGSVNNGDFGLLRNTFGRTAGQAGYEPAFDFDGNGAVNNSDFAQFRARYGRVFQL